MPGYYIKERCRADIIRTYYVWAEDSLEAQERVESGNECPVMEKVKIRVKEVTSVKEEET